MVGIVSFGSYIPSFRIKIADIAAVWGKDPLEIGASLGIVEKAIPARDEDTVTMATAAALRALSHADKKASVIETMLVGSESHPYAVNPTSTIVGELLGIGNQYLAADLEFACKAATAGVQLIAGQLAAKSISYGLAIGADTAQSRPHDVLEYTAGSAAAAVLLGNNPDEIITEIETMTSYSSDTPDFWRRDGMRYPSHSGRFTGEPAYFTHVVGAARSLFAKTHTKAADFDFAIFHMPNGKFPQQVAKRLGFTPEQIAPSLTVKQIGNPYTASTLIGLIATLEQAKPNQRIFMVSYGSGAGSDGFILKTTEHLKKYLKSEMNNQKISEQIAHKQYVNYVEYLKRMKII